jgi:ABC-2 type transport system permease protein
MGAPFFRRYFLKNQRLIAPGPIMLTLTLTLSILLMILLPVLLGAIFHRRFQAPWILFAIGTLTFIGSQVVHFPLNDLLMRWHILPKTGVNDPTISLLQSSLVLGLTAGLCEETARALGFWLLKRSRGLEQGVMLGLGHGGIESMVFGGILTAANASFYLPLIGKDLTSLKATPEQLAILTKTLQALTSAPLVSAINPLVERLLAITLHVILSILVLQAFRRRNVLYYLAAVAYHMLVDSGLVYFASKVPDSALLLLILLALILPGLAWLLLLWRKEHAPQPVYTQSTTAELGIFFAALRKELVQQWRTRRFLVVMAVFILFGLTSPLLAKFTPEIIKSMPGAEKFAGLIPTPTSADALAQYIKNITQFGFILAVLLGMNAVAAEKESGTAAMILSKPMPRWAFILSKFSAQSLMYLAAFLVAGFGAYYYTVILFGGYDVLTFLAINGLLLLWLLTFVGAALVGSVIGSSIAAAAGIGLGISVTILLASNIPQFGMLLPGGLVSWASMLGANSTTISPNGGALAGSAVLIVMCLVWAIALFERQEI